ncbi:MAG TPA: PPOX class F420-dependent oxidoreductase [Ilumatobacteraceae bacterium]|nr:PPOX class F420-dependent oxidoreductase [Ilumatobacteraceae bacterium]
MDDIDNAKYIALTTFKRDGTPKATPVWITGHDGSYLFYTGVDAWKTKRLRNNPAVEVRVCDMRGRVEPHATVYQGTGELLADETSIAEAKQAIADKYGWQAALARAADWTRARVGRGDDPIAIRLTLTAPD